MDFKILFLILILMTPMLSAEITNCATEDQLTNVKNQIFIELTEQREAQAEWNLETARTIELFKVEIMVATQKEVSKQVTRIIVTVIGIFGTAICIFLLFMSIIVTRYFKVERKNLNEVNKHKRKKRSDRTRTES